MTINAIIVDDEPYARDDICELLDTHKNIKIVGQAATVAAAKKLIEQYKPELVFLDVQLFGENGFELIPHIPTSTSVIFVTAFDQYAVRAFEVNAIDYLLKPVCQKRLASSLARIHNTDNSNAYKKNNTVDLHKTIKFQYTDRIFIKTNNEQRFIKLNEITAITSIGGNYTKIHMKNNTSVVSQKTFKYWEQILPVSAFLRIHRMVIINLNEIDRMSIDNSGSHQVHLFSHNQTFSASRRMLPKLKARIEEKCLV